MLQGGRPIGEHEAVGREDRLHRGDDVRSRGRARSLRAHGGRGAQRHQDRGRPRQALVQRDGLAGGGRVRPDPRRPRVRDGRFAPRHGKNAPIPAEQMLRDMRINRIFEGSTEIMHLLIAREAVDAHLTAAGDMIDPKVDVRGKARAAVARRRVLRAAGSRSSSWDRGRVPTSYREFGRLAKHLRYVERSSRKLARSNVLRHGQMAGEAGVQAGLPGPRRRHRRGTVRDVRGRPSGPRCSAPTA